LVKTELHIVKDGASEVRANITALFARFLSGKCVQTGSLILVFLSTVAL
jgi:hypothetical protein